VARPLRFVPPDAVVEVTTRTIHGRFLLRPSPKVNDLVLGILGRAQWLFRVKIHAFVVLSNHWHGLLSVEDASQLAGFVAFVNGNIARVIGRLHDWRQRFWARRYRAIVVADEPSQSARLRYILQNGCQEGMVDRPADWPGLSCVRALTSKRELTGTWHDRTAEFNACRRGRRAIPGAFSQRYRVTLSPLPCWRDLSAARYRAACAELVAAIEAETRDERARSGKECLGAAQVLAESPYRTPEEPDVSPAPFVHAASQQARVVFRAAYAAFVDAFRLAAECLKHGLRANFPPGAFPPNGPFVPIPRAAN
jgi:REP element-mobilizing transposase RayT